MTNNAPRNWTPSATHTVPTTGNIPLVFGILSWLCFPVVFSIIAMVTGSSERKTNPKAKLGFWLGASSLIVTGTLIVIGLIISVSFVATAQHDVNQKTTTYQQQHPCGTPGALPSKCSPSPR